MSPRFSTAASPRTIARVQAILRWTTVALLFGHDALAALDGKPLLIAQFGALGLGAPAVTAQGWIEIGMAVAVAFRPGIALLIGVALWKLGTESLWMVTGAPIWEFVERSGTYAAPLALAFLIHWRRRSKRVTADSLVPARQRRLAERGAVSPS